MAVKKELCLSVSKVSAISTHTVTYTTNWLNQFIWRKCKIIHCAMKFPLLYFDTKVIFVNIQSLPFVLPPHTHRLWVDMIVSKVLFCYVMWCHWVSRSQHFEATLWSHLQGWRVYEESLCSCTFQTLKMQPLWCLKMWITKYLVTPHHCTTAGT